METDVPRTQTGRRLVHWSATLHLQLQGLIE